MWDVHLHVSRLLGSSVKTVKRRDTFNIWWQEHIPLTWTSSIKMRAINWDPFVPYSSRNDQEESWCLLIRKLCFYLILCLTIVCPVQVNFSNICCLPSKRRPLSASLDIQMLRSEVHWIIGILISSKQLLIFSFRVKYDPVYFSNGSYSIKLFICC